MIEEQKKTKDETSDASDIVLVPHRKIDPMVRVLLFVRSAGRCEFDGCNEDLLQHPVTLKEGNFAEMAHIVAFKKAGPRGDEGERPAEINSADNLMLLCQRCHKHVDDNEKEFPRARLETFKREHEDRIAHVTSIGPDRKTAVLSLTAPIGGQAVAIPRTHVFAAVLPRYPVSKGGLTIDLGDLSGGRESDGFYQVAREKIDRDVDRFFAADGEGSGITHVSVFGLGPIPLLIHLGAKLTNKVPSDLYQRHRDTEDWVWKEDGEPITYTVALRSEGKNGGPVALILALSGSIPTESLPDHLREGAWLYEISLDRRVPEPTFLRRRDDLDAFRVAFQEALGRIAASHGLLKDIDLIPAIPAPVAILVGRERLPKVHPALRVFDRTKDGYVFAFEVT